MKKNNMTVTVVPKQTKLICIEGSDGSGKQTHAKHLAERLIAEGFTVKIISFPQYENESSVFVKKYLSGEYGSTANSVDPYIASNIFAIDRLVSYLNSWKTDLESHDFDFIILDRYVTSNLLHQGCKLPKSEMLSFIKYWQDFEYDKLKLPVPNIVYYLDMPRWASKILTANRPNKATGGNKQDIHESDESYMLNVEQTSRLIAKMCRWVIIPCTNQFKHGKRITNGTKDDIHSIEDINQTIYDNLMIQIK